MTPDLPPGGEEAAVTPSEPVPPIVVSEGAVLQLHRSVAEACLDLEAIDVRDGVYEAFDGRGRRLSLDAHGEEVRMTLPEAAVPEVGELMRRLRAYAAALGEDRVPAADVRDASLERLLDLIAAVVHPPRAPARRTWWRRERRDSTLF